MPTRIYRYILSEISGVFFGALIFIVFILLMFQVLRLSEFFIVNGAKASLLAQVAIHLCLSFLPTALPLAFLIAILTAFGRLSGDSELIALRACGVSGLQLALPGFGFSLFVMLVTFFVNQHLVPWGEKQAKIAQVKISNSRAVQAIKPGTFTEGFFDLLIFADKVDHERLFRVFIYDGRQAKNPMTYVAREAEIIPVKSHSELGAAIMLRLHDGSLHHNNMHEFSYEKVDFTTYLLHLQIHEGKEGAMLKPSMLSGHEVHMRLRERPILIEYWRRIATAITPVLFVPIGVGFGSYRTRTARSGAILIALLVMSVYWTLQTWSIGLARDSFPPFLAMNIPNVAILLIGLLGLLRT